jgi:hypothetical protein
LILSVKVLTTGIAGERKLKPTIYLIGGSTVKNGSGKGDGGFWGWGDYLYQKAVTKPTFTLLYEAPENWYVYSETSLRLRLNR